MNTPVGSYRAKICSFSIMADCGLHYPIICARIRGMMIQSRSLVRKRTGRIEMKWLRPKSGKLLRRWPPILILSRKFPSLKRIARTQGTTARRYRNRLSSSIERFRRDIDDANLRRCPQHRGTAASSENRELRSVDASGASCVLERWRREFTFLKGTVVWGGGQQ